MFEAGGKRLAGAKISRVIEGHEGAYKPYAKKRHDLLNALRDFGKAKKGPGRHLASVARMERSAIRVIVSGAGKSRVSLRFMRATD